MDLVIQVARIWLTTKLGWGNILRQIRVTVRQKTALVHSFRFSGTSTTQLRRVLFSVFVLPHFTRLFAICPLFTDTQRADLSHLYFTLLKRIYHYQYWEDLLFSSIYNEKTLDDHCYRYWEKYLNSISKTRAGYLLLEHVELNAYRSKWQCGESSIRSLHKSKRFVEHMNVLGQAIKWMGAHETKDSVIECNIDELLCFACFPETLNSS